MNLWIDIPVFIIGIFYAWLASFMIHEWMHIKSQGLFMTGIINVGKCGMTCAADTILDKGWYYFSGGLLSGILHLLIGLPLWYYGVWALYIPIITFAVINLAYSFYEWKIGTENRFRVYGTGSNKGYLGRR